MSKLLIVDDEAKIREMILKYARHENYDCDEACDGEEAVEKCSLNHYDLIVMDVMMPNLDGFSACREIRKITDTPIIMLTALGEEYDKIHGFDLGIDDYVVKPFSCKELMMRIQAILKRSSKTTEHEMFKMKDLEIDYSSRIVTIRNERIKLSPKEYELLLYLIENEGIALTREQILSTIWGYSYYNDDRTLDTHIKLLRKNLQEYGACIVTLRGVGYRFEKID